MDIVSGAKNVGAALATASTLGYASGYLVLRARAYALGTDPNFKFLDETYVFAGFRFLFVALIALLVAAPVLLLVRGAALWIRRLLNPAAFTVVEWIAVGGLAVIAFLGFQILQVRGILLAHEDARGGPPRLLVNAALGANAIGLYVTVVTVALAALAASWLYARWSQAAGFDLIFVLVIVTVLQLVMLPVYHGMLYADRNVRVLDRPPAGVMDLMPPVGIVDRTADYAAVFGQTATGQRRIVTVKTEDLNGVAVVGIEPLGDFLARLAKRAATGAVAMGLVWLPAIAVTASPVAEVVAPPAAMEAGTPMTDVQRSFWTRVTDYLNATFEAISSLNEGKAVSGRIWIVEVDGVAARGTARPVTALDNLSWPVSGADGRGIYALRGRQVVRLTESNGAVTPVGGQASWRKLIGDADGALLGFVADGPFGRPAVMSAAGVLSIGPPPQTNEDRMRHAVLSQDSRTYADGRRLVVRSSERGGRGLDVFIERDGHKPTNLSDCGDDFCGQPSLSADGTRVLWIRSPAL